MTQAAITGFILGGVIGGLYGHLISCTTKGSMWPYIIPGFIWGGIVFSSILSITFYFS